MEEIINKQLEKIDYFKLLDILQTKHKQMEKEIANGNTKKTLYILLAINYLMEKYEQLKMFDLNCKVLIQINEFYFAKSSARAYSNRLRADHCAKLISILN